MSYTLSITVWYYSFVAAKSLAVNNFMADTVKYLKSLESRLEDMKNKRELMIMNIQVNFQLIFINFMTIFYNF
jgi:hypothetical protein